MRSMVDKSVQFMDFHNTVIIEIITMGDGEGECIEILLVENGKLGLQIQAMKAEDAVIVCEKEEISPFREDLLNPFNRVVSMK